MSETVYILVGRGPDEAVIWMRASHQGGLKSHGRADDFADLVDKHPSLSDERVIALLPGECTALRLLQTPPRGGQAFLSAARYLLEDSLAEDIDDLHVAAGRRSTDGKEVGLCAAVRREIVEVWHDTFLAHGVFPDLLTADFMALPIFEGHADTPNDDAHFTAASQPGGGSLTIFSNQDGLVANGTAGGFALDPQTAISVLEDVIAAWQPGQIDFYTDYLDLQNSAARKVNKTDRADLQTLAQLISTGLEPGVIKSVPNFLTGQFGRKVDWKGAVLPWRAVGIAASVCAVLFFSGWIAEGMRSGKSAQRFTELSGQIHQNAFPEAQGANPVTHARQILSTQSASIGFDRLWAAFGNALTDIDGVQVESMTFNAAGPNMRVGVSVDSFETLNSYKQALAERGIIAQETRMNGNSAGQYTGDLIVEF